MNEASHLEINVKKDFEVFNTKSFNVCKKK